MVLVALNVYFRKKELPENLQYPFICFNELFPSDWTILMPPLAILAKVNVMS
jgi:hypothetical protein